MANPPTPDLSPRQTAGLVIYLLGTGLPVLVLAHGLLNFGWCLAIAGPLAAVAGALALCPAWAGSWAGLVAAAAALGLTRGWVAVAGFMELGAFQPRAFLFLAVPTILGLVPGFALYAFLRWCLGLPLTRPGRGPDQPQPEEAGRQD